MFNKHLEMIGKNVTDKVTGKKGVVTLMSFDLFGCIQAGVSCKADKDGVVPDNAWYDVNRLKSGKVAIDAVYPAELPLKVLGKVGIDKATQFKGVVTSVVVHINGTVEVLMTSKIEKDDKPAKSYHFIIDRVEVTGRPVMQVPDFVKGAVAEAKKGPADKSAMSRV